MTLPLGFKITRIEVPPLEALIAALPWEQRTFRMFGRDILQPRLTAWMGTGTYTYSRQRHEPAPMPMAIVELRADVEAATGHRFNSVLANRYRSGADSVAWHADDEPELGSRPMIASVSIGAPRVFSIRDAVTRKRVVDIVLQHGDLLVMSGRSQLDYQHSVPKARDPIGERINLTFRRVAM